MSCFSCISPTLCPWAGHSAAIHALSVTPQFFPRHLPLWLLSVSKSHSRKCGATSPSWDEPPNCVPWNYRKRKETKRREGNDVKVVTDTQDRQTVWSPWNKTSGDFISWLMVDLRLLGRIWGPSNIYLKFWAELLEMMREFETVLSLGKQMFHHK